MLRRAFQPDAPGAVLDRAGNLYYLKQRPCIIAEACDMLTTTFVLLARLGVPEEAVRARIIHKCNRALKHYEDTGEA